MYVVCKLQKMRGIIISAINLSVPLRQVQTISKFCILTSLQILLNNPTE